MYSRPAIGPAIWVLTALTCIGPGILAQGPPTLTHVRPGAVAPGRTTELVLKGTHLSGPLRLWTSFPSQVEWVEASTAAGDVGSTDAAAAQEAREMEVRCRLTLPAGAAGGIGGLVIATPQGLSDMYFLMVDELPSLAEADDNHSPSQAQRLTLPIAVDGQSEGTLSDYFQFEARRGERIACEVVATRLGWDYDAVLRIVGPDGAECLLQDDDPATGADARGVFLAPQDGWYQVELRDNRYQAGGRYRLRLGNFPLLTSAHPLVLPAGVATPLAASDIAGQRIGPRELWVAAGGGGPLVPLPVTISTEAPGSGSVLAGATDLPVWCEPLPEPPIAAASTTPPSLGLPVAIAGVLHQPGEVDRFRFAARKGVPVHWRVISRSFGSPAVLSLRVTDAEGRRVAESPPTNTDEPAWAFNAPTDGEYTLEVRELVGRGGPAYSYAVLGRLGAAFTLQLKNDKNNNWRQTVPPGGVLAFDVQCQRQGEEGPIELMLHSPPPGWQLVNGRIAAKSNEGRIYLVAPLDLKPGDIVPLRLVGRSGSGEGSLVPVSTQALLRAARPAYPFPPPWLDGLLLLSGTEGSPPWFRIEPTVGEIFLPRQVGQAQWTLKLHRISGLFKEGPLTLIPHGLPSGLSLETKRRQEGTEELYDLILKGPANLPESSQLVRFFVIGEASGGKAAGQRRGIWTGDFLLQIASPLSLDIQWPSNLVAGRTHDIPVTLSRRGNDPQPVKLQWKSLPQGVRGADEVVVPAEASQVTLELAVAEDAPRGAPEKIVLAATTKYGETEIKTENPSHLLEIKAP